MPTDQKRTPPEEPQRSQHLSVRPDDGRPGDLRFMFETQRPRLGGAVGASLGIHAGLVLFWVLLIWLVPDRIREAILPVQLSRQLVFLAEPGPGGGGGGGNRMPEPPQPAELPEREEEPVPVIDPEPEPPPEEPPVEQLNIPAQLLAVATETTLGAIESNEASESTGSGGGSGMGGGRRVRP